MVPGSIYEPRAVISLVDRVLRRVADRREVIVMRYNDHDHDHDHDHKYQSGKEENHCVCYTYILVYSAMAKSKPFISVVSGSIILNSVGKYYRRSWKSGT